MERARSVDPLFVRATLTWLNWSAATLATLSLLAWLLSSAGRATVHIDHDLPFWLLALWPIAYALAVWKRERVATDPRAGVLRALVVGGGLSLTIALPAAAHDPLSPLWAAPLLLAPCMAQVFPFHPAAFVGAALTLPARWWLAETASPTSLAVAAGVGVLLAASFALLSYKRRAESTRRERARRRSSPERTAALGTAMRVHDGLSGLVMLCRARARVGEDARRTLVDEARALLGALGGAHVREPRDIRRIAAVMSVQLELSIEGDAGLLDCEAGRTALEIATELVANEARHGSQKRIALTLRATRRRVALVARSSPYEAGHDEARSPGVEGGRGLRNLALRARSLGGSVSWIDSGTTLLVVLPRVRRDGTWLSLWVAELAAHAAPALLAMALSDDRRVVLVVMAAAAFTALVQVDNARRAAAVLAAEDAARSRETSATRLRTEAIAKAVLSSAVERLDSRSDDAQAALDVFARDVGALIATLEGEAQA